MYGAQEHSWGRFPGDERQVGAMRTVSLVLQAAGVGGGEGPRQKHAARVFNLVAARRDGAGIEAVEGSDGRRGSGEGNRLGERAGHGCGLGWTRRA